MRAKKGSDLDSSFKFEGPKQIKGKTITRHSTMAGYGVTDERKPQSKTKITVKRNRYG